jgi:hypothetical protein
MVEYREERRRRRRRSRRRRWWWNMKKVETVEYEDYGM